MPSPLQIANIIAFGYIAYVGTGSIRQPLKEGKLVQPIAITAAAISIMTHLILGGDYYYVGSIFAGFFLSSCFDCYVKKEGSSRKRAKRKESTTIKINP